MIEAHGERGIDGAARRCRAEMQAVRRAVDVVEDVVDAGFNLERQRVALGTGGERIVARESPYLVALAVAVQLIVAFAGHAAVEAEAHG